MKTLFYICTKNIDHWDVFTPLEHTQASQNQISILFLMEDHNVRNVPASCIWKLNMDTLHLVDSSTRSMSYQEFLEQIFLHDLSIVI